MNLSPQSESEKARDAGFQVADAFQTPDARPLAAPGRQVGKKGKKTRANRI